MLFRRWRHVRHIPSGWLLPWNMEFILLSWSRINLSVLVARTDNTWITTEKTRTELESITVTHSVNYYSWPYNLYPLRRELLHCQCSIKNSGFYIKQPQQNQVIIVIMYFLLTILAAGLAASSSSFCQNEGRQIKSEYSHSVQYLLDDLVNYVIFA